MASYATKKSSTVHSHHPKNYRQESPCLSSTFPKRSFLRTVLRDTKEILVATMQIIKIQPCHSADDGHVRIKDICISADFKLVIRGTCLKCHGPVIIALPFEELIRDATTLSEVPSLAGIYTVKDIALLHAEFHIAMPPDQKLLP